MMTRPPVKLALSAALSALLGSSLDARAETPPASPVGQPPAPKEAPPSSDEARRPLLTYRFSSFELRAPLLVGATAEGASSFPVDRDQGAFQAGLALSPVVRGGVQLDTIKPLDGKFIVFAEYEHDLVTGTWTSSAPITGSSLPNSTPISTSIRKGWARFSVGPYLHVGGGLMTSHWGMGLVANDGAHGWEPGSARFTDPRGGDLVVRGFVGMGPLTRAHIATTIAVESVREDSLLLEGDSAYQAIASVLIGRDQPSQLGYFLVHRHQSTADGSALDANVIDVAGRITSDRGRAKLTIEAEGALVLGTTTLGASPEAPRSDILQLGGALRGALSFERAGGVLDLLYASGDGNTHDGRVHSFHANPNFETGLLLFRYVQAAQTGRGGATAADPQIVGAPPGGADRIPTRGGMTNAVVVFPRVWARPLPELEAYGGALFALAPGANIDPFNTDVAGGARRNALNGPPGSYWGTEIDVGARYKAPLLRGELTAGAEGGVLFPGSALAGADQGMETVFGGRLMFTYRL